MRFRHGNPEAPLKVMGDAKGKKGTILMRNEVPLPKGGFMCSRAGSTTFLPANLI